jgi:CubicO group peptidase (beta-lactamase class C family)
MAEWTPEPRAMVISGIRSILQPGIDAGRYPGAQVYAAAGGEVLADMALGDARIGVPMTPDTIVSWQCNTKPVVAVAVCQLWERGLVELDAPVARYLPDFARHGKGAITLRHLLTHSARFNGGQGMVAAAQAGHDAVEARICDAALDPEWPIGRKARYTPAAGYAALGCVVRRVDGRPLDIYVREEIFEPLGMLDCWIGVAPAEVGSVADRMAVLYDTQGDTPEFALVLGKIARTAGLAACEAGTGGIGPMRELALFYRALLDSRAGRPGALLKRNTMLAMIDGAQLEDGSHGAWGLGLQVASGYYGTWFPQAFGHEGLQFSMAFADPEHNAVFAGMVNGIERPGSLKQLLEVSRLVYDALPSG